MSKHRVPTNDGETTGSISLVAHVSVTISAPPAKVWPSIVDPSSWKKAVKSLLATGTADEVGACFHVVLPNDPNTILYRIVNVEMIPEVRRTIRLESVDGLLLGFSSWKLSRSGPSTDVDYDVYTHIPMAAVVDGQAGPRTVEFYQAQHNERFRAELETLRTYIENGEVLS